MSCLLAPFTMCGLSSLACCAASTACQLCCSLASCFGCSGTTSAVGARVTYVGIFGLSATLAVFLRYWGQAALSSWTSTLGVCTDGACWGQQADYRISGAVFAFFALLCALTAAVKAAHAAAWLLKLLLFITMLGLTLLIPNDFWAGYSQFARYASILFLIAQVLIIVDAAYTVHEALLARVDARDAALDAQGWEPGLCSNGWKVLYVLLAAFCIGFAIAGLGAMYHYMAACPLNQFFLSETLILGSVFTLASLHGSVGKGLLPPAALWAYNVYLCFGAITNNPDEACNALASTSSGNSASVITGAVISVLAVTWVAFTSADGIYRAVATSEGGGEGGGAAYGATARTNPIAGDAEAGGARSSGAPKAAGTAPAAAAGGAVPEWTAGGGGAGAAAPGGASAYAGGDAPPPAAVGADRRPWLFHAIMALGGLYLAMVTTNWGTAATDSAGSNPELSVTGMWVRIGSQWAIHALYAWTLVAPFCCPNRDFS